MSNENDAYVLRLFPGDGPISIPNAITFTGVVTTTGAMTTTGGVTRSGLTTFNGGVVIGPHATPLRLTGAFTTGITISADGTTGVSITSGFTGVTMISLAGTASGDGILISGACADAIHISGTNTTSAIHISGDQVIGILYDVDAAATDGLKILVDDGITLGTGINIDRSGTTGVCTTAISIDTDGTTGIEIAAGFTGATGISIGGTCSTAALVIGASGSPSGDFVWYGTTASYAVTFDANGDTNGSVLIGANTKGIMFNLYGDVTGCGVFWDPSADTNGTLTIGGTAGSKGVDVIMYGATSGACCKWDQSTDDLLIVGAAQLLIESGSLSVGKDAAAGTVTLYPGTTAKGITTVTMSDNSGATTTNINIAEQAGARTITIPDAGASANVVLMASAQAVAGTLTRADLTEEALAVYGISINQVMAADGAPLAVAETAGDFFLNLGTNFMELRGEEAISETESSVGYIQFVLPPEYVNGGDVRLRLRCQIDGAGTNNGSTIDIEAYEMADGAVGSDLCDTTAQTFAAKTTYYDKDFVITATTLASGDTLVIKVTSSVIESAGSALAFYSDPPKLLLDIKG